MENQEALFNKTLSLKNDLEDISGFLQNPFNMMLKQGYVTKKELGKSINELNNRFDILIDNLKNLKIEYLKEIQKYI